MVDSNTKPNWLKERIIHHFERGPNRLAISIGADSLTWKDIVEEIEDQKSNSIKHRSCLLIAERSAKFYLQFLASICSNASVAVIHESQVTGGAFETAHEFPEKRLFGAGLWGSGAPRLSIHEEFDEIHVGLFTSGTTAEPKLNWLRLSAFESFVCAVASRFESPNERVFSELVSPSSSISISNFMLSIWLGCVWSPIGSKRDLLDGWTAVARVGAAYFRTTPSILRVLLKRLHNSTHKVDLLLVGGEPVPTVLPIEAFKMGICQRFLSTYGLTETAGWIFQTEYGQRGSDDTTLPIGLPLSGVTVLSPLDAEPARLVVQTEQARSIENPHGRLCTSDLCTIVRNQFHLIGRVDRAFKFNGSFIYPESLEGKLEAILGRRVVIFSSVKNWPAIVVENSTSETDRSFTSQIPNELRAFTFLQLNSFPLTANGKPDYKKIKLLLEEKA